SQRCCRTSSGSACVSISVASFAVCGTSTTCRQAFRENDSRKWGLTGDDDGSVTAEGFFQPPRCAVSRDLGVDKQGALSRAVEPRLDGGKIVGPSNGDSIEAEDTSDCGDIRRR